MSTIYALATPRAKSALAVIRLTGKNAKAIAEKITQKKLENQKIKLCHLFDENNQIFDQAQVFFSQAPKTFTGEDCIEFFTHGSVLIIEKLENQLNRFGANIAKAGEFTQRAFLNAKIDLTQAEAICDLIDAENHNALLASNNSLKGIFSDKIKSFVNDLIAIRVEVEAEIDFIDEGLDFIARDDLHQKIKKIHQSLLDDIKQAKASQKSASGIKIAIVGVPNVGKSSLLNVLIENQRAIVSDEAGTTRDSLIENISLDGLNLKLIDTAGIRKTQSVAENLSIKKSFEAIFSSDILLVVDDLKNPMNEAEFNLMRLGEFETKKIFWVHNKLDLCKNHNQENPLAQKIKAKSLFISATNHTNLDLLKNELKKLNQSADFSENQYLARNRHIEALEKAVHYLNNAILQLNKKTALIDLVAEDLRYTHNALEEILGVYPSDELLGEIFSHFCIGK